MTKPEIRSPKEIRSTNDEGGLSPDIRHSFGFLVSGFDIKRGDFLAPYFSGVTFMFR
jgi:hypothetical protein